jgi:hypothetical protein
MSAGSQQNNLRKGNFTLYGGEDQDGIIIGNVIQPNETAVKEIVEWLSSVANPTAGTYYAVSHTFKAIDRFGADFSAVFNFSNKTNAFVKYHMYLNAYPIVMIKGGTVTGTIVSGGSLGLAFTVADLQSTS